MSNFWTTTIGIVIGLLLGLSIFFALVEKSNRAVNVAREDGVTAGRAGVPAEANPYSFSSERRAWLEGWMEAKK